MFKGLGTALVTPFKANGDVDFEGLENLVAHQLDGGTDVLVVMGTTGEAATMSDKEKLAVLDAVVSQNARQAKVVYGIAGNNTAAVCEEMANFKNDMVDGLLSASPAYNKPTQKGILAHYRALNEATNHPIIVYNVPGRTASNITAETCLEIARLDNMVAVKEASGNLEQIMHIIKERPAGFEVLSGDDALTLPIIAAGGEGLISVASNAYPKLFKTIVDESAAGNMVDARNAHYKVLTQIGNLFLEGNPGGIKAVLAHMGICEDHLRLPLFPVSDTTLALLHDEHTKIVC